MKNLLCFIIILTFICVSSVKAQIIRPEYCKCETVGEGLYLEEENNSVTANVCYDNETLIIDIFNNTKDTIFLFKSYFENDISKSKYIYRYDGKNIKISFLPLIPYLYIHYSDRIILKNRIIKEFQTVYDFYKINPNNKFTFEIEVLDLKRKKDYIRDIDLSKLNKFQKIQKFENVSIKNTNSIDFFIEFAYYNDVSIICDSNSYYFEELNFNKQANEYNIIKIPIETIGNDQ